MKYHSMVRTFFGGLYKSVLFFVMLQMIFSPCVYSGQVPKMTSDDLSRNNSPNRLAKEKSPYLLQHADNPIDWYPWSAEAFARAVKEQKPIFLSIGYSTCHWCHVMARESFADQEVAGILNRSFISIKVDREDRPDIDAIYMNICQQVTGGGGWPLTVIMTPEKKPFFFFVR